MLQNKTNIINLLRRNSDTNNRRSHCRSFIPFRTAFAIAILMVSSLVLDGRASVASSTAAAAAAAASNAGTNPDPDSIKIIFSDLDGTLIHYPKNNNDEKNGAKDKPQNLLKLPPSSTGMRGTISAKTLSLVDEIRHQHGVKFVLISGMRTSTLLQRLPYLPRADAYCSENGGRIFYPVEAGDDFDDDDKTKKSDSFGKGKNKNEDDVFWVRPKKYRHDGNDNDNDKKEGNRHRIKPFGIREDKAWREKMTKAIGGESFGPSSLKEISVNPASTSLAMHEREGFLWDFARDLVHTHGFVLDTKGYSTCFRVNRKQQTSNATADVPPSEILALLDGPRWNKINKHKNPIASSVNLSCVDFYPSCSGKKNCCSYLASKFFPEECEEPTRETDFLSNHAVCLCDDDNDLEMALACHHAYLPDVSSESMKETIDEFPNHFTTTFRDSSNSNTEPTEGMETGAVIVGTDASDLALSMIWSITRKAPDPPES